VSEAILSVVGLGFVVLMLWLSRGAGADAEKVKQMEADRDALAKALSARRDVAAGSGVPVEQDRFNRDNVP